MGKKLAQGSRRWTEASVRGAVLLVTAWLAVTLTGTLVAQERKSAALLTTDIGGKDLLLLRGVAQGGLAQLQLAEMAKGRASSPELKSLAASLIEDYEAADESLRQLAFKKGVQCPTDPGPEEQALIDKAGQTTGTAFDKTYLVEVVRIHSRQVAALESALASKDPDIAAFAKAELPVLREHLALAQKFSDAFSASR